MDWVVSKKEQSNGAAPFRLTRPCASCGAAGSTTREMSDLRQIVGQHEVIQCRNMRTTVSIYLMAQASLAPPLQSQPMTTVPAVLPLLRTSRHKAVLLAGCRT